MPIPKLLQRNSAGVVHRRSCSIHPYSTRESENRTGNLAQGSGPAEGRISPRGKCMSRNLLTLLIGPWDGLHSVPPHPLPAPPACAVVAGRRPSPWGEGEWSTASRSHPCRSWPNNHRQDTDILTRLIVA